MTFKEYVERRNEASFNPFRNIGTGTSSKSLGGEGGDVIKYFGHIPGGLAATPYATAQGLKQVPNKYRSMVHGNPYTTDNPEGTKKLAGDAFKKSSDWLLNYVAKEQLPRARNRLIKFLQEKLVEVENYFRSQESKSKKIAGVNIGQQPSSFGNIFALPVSIISGIKLAAKNVIDTLNPVYQEKSNGWTVNIEKMILALDALNSWEKSLEQPSDLVNAYIKTFLHNLQYGWNAKTREIGLR